MPQFLESRCRIALLTRFVFFLMAASLASSTVCAGDLLAEEDASVILISKPDEGHGYFDKSVILVRRHAEQGSVGVILNRPSEIPLSRVFPENDILKNADQTLYQGGPVSPRVLVFIYRTDEKDPQDSLHIVDDIYLSFHKDRLTEILKDPEQMRWLRVFHGYAGWYEGQLEQELARGSWYVRELDGELIYDQESDSLWERLMQPFRGIWVRISPPGHGSNPLISQSLAEAPRTQRMTNECCRCRLSFATQAVFGTPMDNPRDSVPGGLCVFA